MKKTHFFVVILVMVNIIVICKGNLSAASNLIQNDYVNSGNMIFEEDFEADCWSLMEEYTGARVLECNKPCCYRDDYKPFYPHEPNGTCVIPDSVPPVNSLSSEGGTWKNCSEAQ